MAGALAGIRIVDFGHYIAGPLAAMLLAEHGAEVIHIDRPGAFDKAHPSDAYYNRSKTRVELDLKTPEGKAAARRLIEQSDVVIENFRPGVMDRLGLGAAAMSEALPRLIYCSLPGFHASDPRALTPGWEGVVMAASGGYATIAAHNSVADAARARGEIDDPERPLFSAIPLASNFAGILGATCVVMALIARHRTGFGQRVEVPLAEAMIEATSARFLMSPAHGNARQAPLLRAIGSGTHVCGDGRFINWVTTRQRFLEQLTSVAGVHDAWRKEGLFDPAVEDSAELTEVLTQRVKALFLTKSADEWEQHAVELGIPLALIRPPAEWLANEHARTSESVVTLDDPVLGSTTMAGRAVNVSKTSTAITPRQAPAAIAPDHQQRQPDAGLENPESIERPLDGLFVVDLSQVYAGPITGRLLADFGADVIKINHPAIVDLSHGMRRGVNRGKRTMFLNIRHPAGAEALQRLLDRADVVVQNFVKGTAERYGFGYDDLKLKRPGVVMGSISTYAYTGPWGARRGYEVQGQAATGIPLGYGGPNLPLLHPYYLNDVGTGLLGAFAIGLGLFDRYRTGVGQHVGASLTQTAALHQGAHLLSYAGRVSDEPSGVNARGWSALHRMYAASDGWFFIGARPDQASAVASLAGLDAGKRASGDLTTTGEQAQALEARFATRPRSEWIAKLNAADIGAQAIQSQVEASGDSTFARRGVVLSETVADGSVLRSPGIGPWLTRTPPRPGSVKAPFGFHTAAILTEVGLAAAIPDLVADGATVLVAAD